MWIFSKHHIFPAWRFCKSHSLDHGLSIHHLFLSFAFWTKFEFYKIPLIQLVVASYEDRPHDLLLSSLMNQGCASCPTFPSLFSCHRQYSNQMSYSYDQDESHLGLSFQRLNEEGHQLRMLLIIAWRLVFRCFCFLDYFWIPKM